METITIKPKHIGLPLESAVEMLKKATPRKRKSSILSECVWEVLTANDK